jgi:hypothetical protein
MLLKKQQNALTQPLLDNAMELTANVGRRSTNEKTNPQDKCLDEELLSMLSLSLENKNDSLDVRERRSQARIARTKDYVYNVSKSKDNGWFAGVCPTCPSMRSVLAGLCSCVGVWDKPLLLVTNAMNYLWFLTCYHIYQHYHGTGDAFTDPWVRWRIRA